MPAHASSCAALPTWNPPSGQLERLRSARESDSGSTGTRAPVLLTPTYPGASRTGAQAHGTSVVALVPNSSANVPLVAAANATEAPGWWEPQVHAAPKGDATPVVDIFDAAPVPALSGAVPLLAFSSSEPIDGAGAAASGFATSATVADAAVPELSAPVGPVGWPPVAVSHALDTDDGVGRAENALGADIPVFADAGGPAAGDGMSGLGTAVADAVAGSPTADVDTTRDEPWWAAAEPSLGLEPLPEWPAPAPPLLTSDPILPGGSEYAILRTRLSEPLADWERERDVAGAGMGSSRDPSEGVLSASHSTPARPVVTQLRAELEGTHRLQTQVAALAERLTTLADDKARLAARVAELEAAGWAKGAIGPVSVVEESVNHDAFYRLQQEHAALLEAHQLLQAEQASASSTADVAVQSAVEATRTALQKAHTSALQDAALSARRLEEALEESQRQAAAASRQAAVDRQRADAAEQRAAAAEARAVRETARANEAMTALGAARRQLVNDTSLSRLSASTGKATQDGIPQTPSRAAADAQQADLQWQVVVLSQSKTQTERDLRARETDLEETRKLNTTLRQYMRQQLDTVRDLSRQNVDLASRYHAEVMRHSLLSATSQRHAPRDSVASAHAAGVLAEPSTPGAVASTPALAPATAPLARPRDGATSPPLHVDDLSRAAVAQSPRTAPARAAAVTVAEQSLAAVSAAGMDASSLSLSQSHSPSLGLSTSLHSSASPHRHTVSARLAREILDVRQELDAARKEQASTSEALRRCVQGRSLAFGHVGRWVWTGDRVRDTDHRTDLARHC